MKSIFAKKMEIISGQTLVSLSLISSRMRISAFQDSRTMNCMGFCMKCRISGDNRSQ